MNQNMLLGILIPFAGTTLEMCIRDSCTVLRSMTGGRGTYAYEFARYEQAPSDVQEKEIAARAEE